jgi:hypothetical protein
MTMQKVDSFRKSMKAKIMVKLEMMTILKLDDENSSAEQHGST